MSRSLQEVVAAVESGGIRTATRYEPDVYASPWIAFGSDWATTVATAQLRHGGEGACSIYTARMICSTSWGAYQLMGFDLYHPSVDCQVRFYEVLADPMIQAATWRRLVRSGGFDPDTFNLSDDQLLERFARFYNGPGNVQGYHDRLVAARDAED